MSLTQVWSTRTSDVEAVQVLESNIRDVADWCGGTVARTLTDSPELYIAVDTIHFGRHRESKVFVGDWIVYVTDEFKHHTDRVFKQTYQKKADRHGGLVALLYMVSTGEISVDKAADGVLKVIGGGKES